jgi:hypothetical protein
MNADAPSGRSLLLASLLSLVVAAVILVTLVLPAEYDIDPLGTGALLGLTGLAAAPQSVLEPAQGPLHIDSVSYTLNSFESVEYKYRMPAGATLVFSWQATAPVSFDLHAEPDGADEGFAESFAKASSAGESGSYHASFSGIHGWFWENRGPEPVTVTLRTAGFYTEGTEYRDGFVISRPLGEFR